ncbi:MAG: translocation/assembly module TamB domain-containing protein [Oceanospirillaceae bacterium]|nr:translocation/assembly module TamB domain-containing protein [Oceanospirillaceae bacterium]
MKRWTLRVLLGLLLLLLLLLGAVAAIGLTETGTSWLVGRVQPLLPGELSYRDLRGRLLGRLELEGLEYRQQALQLTAGRVEFAWTPAALLQGRLQLDSVGVDVLDLKLPPGTESPEQTPPATLQLPDSIAVPLQIRVDSIYGRQLRIEPYGAEPLLIDSVELGLHSEGRRLVLDRFDISAPQGELALAGDVDAAGDYPLDFSLQWRAVLPEYGELSGSGGLTGSLRSQLSLTQQLQGLADLALEAQLHDPLGAPQWQLTLDLTRFDPEPFVAELAGHALSGKVELQGGLEAASGTLSVDGSLPDVGAVALSAELEASPEQLRLGDARIRLPDTGALISIDGLVSALRTAPQLDLRLDWQGLRYPLPKDVPAQFASDKGELRITGPLEDYRLELVAALAGEQVPAADLTLEGQGNLQGFSVLALRIDSLGGELTLDGQADWAPQPAWKLQARARDIDPGLQWPEWQGTLGFSLATEGSLADGVPQLLATLESLSGQLRDQPLSGEGKVQLQGSDLTIDRLQLGWGNAKLAASGQAGEQLALDWQLEASDLATLLPDAAGKISARGTLSGPRETPALAADISAAALAFQGNRLEQLNGALALDLGWRSPARIDLEARNILAAGQSIDSLSLVGGGAQQDHSLDLSLDSEAATLAMRLEGGLFEQQWRGRLSRLELEQPEAGRWTLEAPAALVLAAGSASSESLCLAAQNAGGRLCVDGQWRAAGESAGKLRLERLPLALLSPWIPTATQIEGFVNADARAQLAAGGALSYQAHLTLDETRLTLPDEGLAFDLDEARIDADGNQNRGQAELVLRLDDVDGRMNASVAVDDLQGQGKLSGQLQLALEDLSFISVLVPDIRVGGGRVNGDIRLAGNLQQPRISGALALDDGRVEVPASGIALELLQLKLRDDPARPDHMLLEGSAVSGGGELSLSGDLQPLLPSARIDIRGDRFQAVGTPEIQVYISPQMQVEYRSERIAVRGELVVPEAMITPPTVSAGAVTVSPDAVIVDADGEPEPLPFGPVMDLSLRLTLGEKVQVDAFGFRGRLTGSMMLTEDARRVTRATGNIGVATGEYTLYGQDMAIERGSLVYTGGPVDNPGLNLRVRREVEDVIVGASVAGSLRQPSFELFSQPSMPDSSKLSYLMFGRAPGASTTGEQAALAKLALSLGREGGSAVGEKLTETLNIDEIGFGGGDTLEETSLYLGKYLSPRLYIKYGVGLLEPTSEFVMRYQLTKKLVFESNTGTEDSGADLFYSLER